MDGVQVLADAGNLIARLQPLPVVARVTTFFGDEDPDHWRSVLARELKVSLHLKQQGVPVVAPTPEVNPGPHAVGGTWFTLWEYIPPVRLSVPTPEEALRLLQQLEAGMLTYQGDLPILGAWIPAAESVAELLKTDDGNLLPGPSGWLWSDFEDASLMPRYWDLAAAVGRTFILGEAREMSESLIRGVLGEQPGAEEQEASSLWPRMAMPMRPLLDGGWTMG